MTHPISRAARRAALAITLTIAATGIATAAPILNTGVLDQSQTLSNAALLLGSSTVAYAQTFTQGSTAILDHIAVSVNNVGGLVTLRLYAGSLPSVSTAVLLGSASNAAGNFDLSGSGIQMTAGNAYTFVLTGGSGMIRAADTNAYANGRLGFLYNDAGFYADAPGLDMTFQTFDAIASANAGAAVAEPTTLAVLGIGLVGLGIARARRGREDASGV